VFGLDNAEQGTPKVDDQQLGLRCSLGPDDFAAQDPQRGSLSALVVSEHQQVWVLPEIDRYRLQSALLETEQNVLADLVTGSCQDGFVVDPGGQQRHRGRGRFTVPAAQHVNHAHTGFGESGGRLDPVQPGQRDQHVQPVARKAAARSVAGNLVRPLAVYLGFGGIAQP
jgi:hypothetical protein